MARPPKEFQAFTSLVDQLLTVPKEELDARMVAYEERADKEEKGVAKAGAREEG